MTVIPHLSGKRGRFASGTDRGISLGQDDLVTDPRILGTAKRICRTENRDLSGKLDVLTYTPLEQRFRMALFQLADRPV